MNGSVRRSTRPGHDQHPLHDLRPFGRRRRDRPERARADLPEARLGRARPPRDLDPLRGGDRGALAKAGITASDLAAIGITNQRETTVVWDRKTGKPVYNAIVWQDTRTDTIVAELAERRRPGPLPRQGRPAAGDLLLRAQRSAGSSTTSRAPAAKAEAGDLLFGTIDTWLIWNLTGGPSGGVHVTDVTQRQPHHADEPGQTLDWDDEMPRGSSAFRGPCCPAIGLSSEVYGKAVGDLAGIPIAGDLGDQQAALFGQTCFSAGEAKNTYGTGCFMLLNTGTKAGPVEERPADHGRLPASAASRPSTPSKARSRSPAPSSSGCATTWA